MFIGHFGVGLGAKRAAPRVSLGTLFLGAQFIDLLWPLLLLLGLEQVRVLPGAPAGSLVGLDLWSRPAVALALELAVFGCGLALYRRATRPRDASGTRALLGLVAFLLLATVANLSGPPPPDSRAVAWAGQAQWIIVGWGYWIDRHRKPAVAPPGNG